MAFVGVKTSPDYFGHLGTEGAAIRNKPQRRSNIRSHSTLCSSSEATSMSSSTNAIGERVRL